LLGVVEGLNVVEELVVVESVPANRSSIPSIARISVNIGVTSLGLAPRGKSSRAG